MHCFWSVNHDWWHCSWHYLAHGIVEMPSLPVWLLWSFTLYNTNFTTLKLVLLKLASCIFFGTFSPTSRFFWQPSSSAYTELSLDKSIRWLTLLSLYMDILKPVNYWLYTRFTFVTRILQFRAGPAWWCSFYQYSTVRFISTSTFCRVPCHAILCCIGLNFKCKFNISHKRKLVIGLAILKKGYHDISWK